MIVARLATISLQGAKIVGVAELGAELLENGPIVIPARRVEALFEVPAEVGLDRIVVDEGVIDVEEEDGFGCGHPRFTPLDLTVGATTNLCWIMLSLSVLLQSLKGCTCSK